METVANLRVRADRLRAFLGSQGLKVSKATALEAQAAQFAVRDWNTLSALTLKSNNIPKAANFTRLGHSELNYGYEYLAPFIGRKLPAKLGADLEAQIEQLRQAISISELAGGWLSRVEELRTESVRCPECNQAGLERYLKHKDGTGTEFECPACLEKFDVVNDLIIPQMLQSRDAFLRIRHGLSKKVGPILGYESFDNTAGTQHQNAPLVNACRTMADVFRFAVEMACSEFGIDKATGDDANLGYYIGSDEMADNLHSRGVSRSLASDLGWLRAHEFKSDPRPYARGLVVTFLPDPTGGPISFWGYCPKSIRPRDSSDEPLAYVVSKGYSKDAVFLGHLIDSRPLVLVPGFMHAIALRRAGLNAVAVPSFVEMSELAIRTVVADRKFIVVSGNELESNATERLEQSARALGVECRYMNSLGFYEGVEGFDTDRFVLDYLALLNSESRGQLRKAAGKRGATGTSSPRQDDQPSSEKILNTVARGFEKFLTAPDLNGELSAGWSDEHLDYAAIPMHQIIDCVRKFLHPNLISELHWDIDARNADHPAISPFLEYLHSQKLILCEKKGFTSDDGLWDVKIGVKRFKRCVLLDKVRASEVVQGVVAKWGKSDFQFNVVQPSEAPKRGVLK